MPHILIVKCAALGDVVRTSHLAAALAARFGAGLRLSFVTAPSAVPLLARNPHIHDLWTDFAPARAFAFDRVFSLEEDQAIVAGVAGLRAGRITGVIPAAGGGLAYTPDSAGWFDMSLVSRHGCADAARLKRENRRSHSEIMAEMFEVGPVPFAFFGDPALEASAREWRRSIPGPLVGINPFAGARWPSKALRPDELRGLVAALLAAGRGDLRLALLGTGEDRRSNRALAAGLGDPRILVPDTDASVLDLAATIGVLDYLVTSDSLALHLALAQGVPFLAFFAPTSAAEIDEGGIGVKLVSTAPDSGSYRPDADNASITAARIMDLATAHRPALFAPPAPVPSALGEPAGDARVVERGAVDHVLR